MKVSVVIRVHGSAPYLLEALQSALNQDCDFRYQVWLILDKVSDSVYLDLRSTSNSKVRIYKPKSTGFASPLSELIPTLESEYVAILDSDDLMISNRLREQCFFLDSNQDFAVVGSSIQLIDESGNDIGKKKFCTDADQIYRQRFKKLPLAHSAVTYRRISIVEIGGYRSFYDSSEDYDLWLRVLEKNKVVNLPEVLTKYRIHSEQTTSADIKKNALAGIAARISGKRRLKGLPDLSLQHEHISQLLKNPKIWAEVTYRTVKRKLWSNAAANKRSKRYYILLVNLFLLCIVNPGTVLQISIRKLFKIS